jgi:hypothetical protein
MSEATKGEDPRPVSAVLYPTKGLLVAAKRAGELDRILGGRDGDRIRSVCLRGQFVRPRVPGAASVGERFFDWEKTGSKFSTEVGRLKPEAEVRAVLAGVEHVDEKGQELPGLKAETAFHVEEFREAVAQRAAR